MRKRLAIGAALLAAASGVALWLAVSSAGAPVRAVAPSSEIIRRAGATAAREALGRRVLVLNADPGKPRTCEVLESARTPEGWSLLPAVPPASGEFGAWLSGIAGAVSASWDPERGPPDGLRRALSLFAVKALVVDDAGKGAPPLRVFEEAEPVLRVGATGDTQSAGDAVALADALAATPARESDGWTWSDWDDELWGGSVTVTTKQRARFVFPYPAVGGRVTVDARDAARRAAGPLLVLDLPAGTSRVAVRFVEPAPGEALAIGGAAGIVLSLLALILAFRPSRAEVVAEAERRATAAP